MAQVISATTKFAAAGLTAKRQRLEVQAFSLLTQARHCVAQGDVPAAVEFAYQAALRGAGAWVAGSAVAGRKRLPSSAWDQLGLVSPTAREWAVRLREYSRPRARLISGLDATVSEDWALQLIALVGQFLDVLTGAAEPQVAA